MNKYNFIVGNPPYQNNSKVLYDKMMLRFFDLDYDELSMIIPNRYMISTLKKFRNIIQNHPMLYKIIEYPDDFEVFPEVWIRGGVQIITFRKSNENKKDILYQQIMHGKIIRDCTREKNNIKKYDIIIRDPEDEEIIDTITKMNPNKIQISNVSFDIKSDYADYAEHPFENCIKLYGQRQKMIPKNGGIKGIGYIKGEYKHLNKYKVITRIATSNNSKRAINPVFIIEKNAVCSDTYKVLGLFDNLKDAENFCLYISTKFVRYLVNIRKIGVMLRNENFNFVPEPIGLCTDSDLLQYYKLEKYTNKIQNTIIDRKVNHIDKEQYPRDTNLWVNKVKWVD